MEPLSPGVYVEADDVRLIQGVSTATTAFVGVTEEGPLDSARLVTSFAEFAAQYGTFLKNSFLAHSTLQFFKNGGQKLYIARVAVEEGKAPAEEDFRNAFRLLDPITDINIIAVPGIGSPSMANFGADYCQQRRDCFFIADMDAANGIEEAAAFVQQLDLRNSYAAVYFPWIEIADPSGATDELVEVPSSGSVAGAYARNDAERGVWKAPAGRGAMINGAVRLSVDVSTTEQDKLNKLGVNVIRSFPAEGIVIWGARNFTNDSEFKYVSTRRLEIFLEQSISRGISWVHFEPNDEKLWSRLRRDIGAFMMEQWRAGALLGISAQEAFFIRVDRTTMTQADIDAGNLNVHVGFAPLKPAEFVIIRIGQWADRKPDD